MKQSKRNRGVPDKKTYTGNRRREKERRAAEAIVLQAEYDKLTVTEKIAKLDFMLGKGIGAVKQRARLKELQA